MLRVREKAAAPQPKYTKAELQALLTHWQTKADELQTEVDQLRHTANTHDRMRSEWKRRAISAEGALAHLKEILSHWEALA